MSISSMLLSYLKKQAERSEVESREAELSLVEKSPGAELLDLGCADGEFTIRVAKRIGTRNIHGVEVVDGDARRAEANGIDVHRGDLNEGLPFKSETFDVIIASHIIEHLCGTDTFIREAHRTLKVGGYIIIATPNLASFPNILFLLLGKQPTVMEVSDEALVGTWSPRGRSVGRIGPAHRRVFTLSALKGLLEYHGFKVEKSIMSGFLPFPNSVARILSHIDKRHATNITVKARKISRCN